MPCWRRPWLKHGKNMKGGCAGLLNTDKLVNLLSSDSCPKASGHARRDIRYKCQNMSEVSGAMVLVRDLVKPH